MCGSRLLHVCGIKKLNVACNTTTPSGTRTSHQDQPSLYCGSILGPQGTREVMMDCNNNLSNVFHVPTNENIHNGFLRHDWAILAPERFTGRDEHHCIVYTHIVCLWENIFYDVKYSPYKFIPELTLWRHALIVNKYWRVNIMFWSTSTIEQQVDDTWCVFPSSSTMTKNCVWII